jgi:hypothetical protein
MMADKKHAVMSHHKASKVSAYTMPACVMKISRLAGTFGGGSNVTYANLVNESAPTFDMTSNNPLTVSGGTNVPSGTFVLGTITGIATNFVIQPAAVPSTGTQWVITFTANNLVSGTLPTAGTTVSALLEVSAPAATGTVTDSLVISLGF